MNYGKTTIADTEFDSAQIEQQGFIEGFSEGSLLRLSEAREQWEWYSRSLPDAEVRRIEAHGYSAGRREGENWYKLYREVSP